MFTPPGRWIKTWPHGRHHFMCTRCRDYYLDACSKPLKGIDRPEGVAPEDWRGSILDHINHGLIAMAFENRNENLIVAKQSLHRPGDAKRFTPAQLQQIMVLRKHLGDGQ